MGNDHVVLVLVALGLTYHSIHYSYSAAVGEGSIAISLSVCLSSVCEYISGTTGSTLKKFFAQIPCGRGSVLFWRRCDTLCSSGFMDDVKFGRNGPYVDAWKAEPLTYYH